jgi:hypothetical protein
MVDGMDTVIVMHRSRDVYVISDTRTSRRISFTNLLIRRLKLTIQRSEEEEEEEEEAPKECKESSCPKISPLLLLLLLLLHHLLLLLLKRQPMRRECADFVFLPGRSQPSIRGIGGLQL